MTTTLTSTSIQWATTLISYDTTSRNSNLELIDVIRQELVRFKLEPVLVPNVDGTKANLFVTIPADDGSVTGGVMLAGHTDTVPVDGQEWSSDPFAAEIRDDRLYGRGTADMKAFSGVVLGMLPEFLGHRLSAPLHLAFTYDEEVGCHGALSLIQELTSRGISPDMCFVGEPTNMRAVSAHKSSHLYRVIFTGLASHSSNTPNGVNAIEYAARAISFIRQIADEHQAEGPFDVRFEVPHTTANVGVIEGGVAVNTVAERCAFEFEFRTIPSVDPAEVIKRIKAFVLGDLLDAMRKEDAAADIRFDVIGAVPSLSADGEGAALRLAQTLTGNTAEDAVGYGTEGGLFQLAGIDTVVCGPGSIKQGHTADEYVELTQIQACEEFMLALAARLSLD
ncbi:acetylornithine deacetylase [Cryobacterium sp. CAN_C3]|uniref:acetylornithine deacetylase n=1 Tax=unclassified Cryobacterium TaxID=2649013 RepID=UPI0018CB60F8|nr:acetylornithine deacetylase [Cryobacterium sp. CAN_C3]MEC5155403.1 acetylornithine deacetylase [Cryobacterium sp. CAN_C3]